uniref:Uncharacterized protein n=1 Tax=Timema genevievae TaxID=629358 RepID=A0A7R9JWF9_TIMGE|nr:unnamed protein product [Timema genevievae]
MDLASITAIRIKYAPMQRSARARLHMRNLGTVILNLDDRSTSSTARLPTSAATATTHTAARSPQLPMRSSQGLKASGSGAQTTSRAWTVPGFKVTPSWWKVPSCSAAVIGRTGEATSDPSPPHPVLEVSLLKLCSQWLVGDRLTRGGTPLCSRPWHTYLVARILSRIVGRGELECAAVVRTAEDEEIEVQISVGSLSNNYTELRLQLFFRSKPFRPRLTGQPAGLTRSFIQSIVCFRSVRKLRKLFLKTSKSSSLVAARVSANSWSLAPGVVGFVSHTY